MLRKVGINITELCNLKCGFCPRSTWYPNRNLNMSLDTAEVIAKQLSQIDGFIDLGEFKITGRGEPTLHPEFDKIIEIFWSYGLKNMILYSNGARLDRYKESLAKLDWLRWDVYSDDEEDFLEAVSKIKTYKSKNKWVYMKPDNKDEGGIIRHKWVNGKISFNMNQPFVDNRGGTIGTNQYENLYEFKDEMFKTGDRCGHVHRAVYIDWNGNYNLCWINWDPKSLGNIHDENIISYYKNNKFLNAYKNGIRNRAPLSPCDVCTVLK